MKISMLLLNIALLIMLCPNSGNAAESSAETLNEKHIILDLPQTSAGIYSIFFL